MLPSPWTRKERDGRPGRPREQHYLSSSSKMKSYSSPKSGCPTSKVKSAAPPQTLSWPLQGTQGGCSAAWWSCPALGPPTDTTQREAKTILHFGSPRLGPIHDVESRCSPAVAIQASGRASVGNQLHERRGRDLRGCCGGRRGRKSGCVGLLPVCVSKLW